MIPILVVTTDTRFKMQQAARAAGATDILMLPVNPLVVADHVERLLACSGGAVA